MEVCQYLEVLIIIILEMCQYLEVLIKHVEKNWTALGVVIRENRANIYGVFTVYITKSTGGAGSVLG